MKPDRYSTISNSIDFEYLIMRSFVLTFESRCWQHLPKAIGVVIQEQLFLPGEICWVCCNSEVPNNFRNAFDYGVSFGWVESNETNSGSDNLTEQIKLVLFGQTFVWRFYVADPSHRDTTIEKIKEFFTVFTEKFLEDHDLQKQWLECIVYHVVLVRISNFKAFVDIHKNESEHYLSMFLPPLLEYLNIQHSDIVTDFVQERFVYLSEIGKFSKSWPGTWSDDSENILIWEFRSKYFSFFRYFLKGKPKPFFFMYSPFTRQFNYRGLLPQDIYLEDQELEVWRSFEKQVLETSVELKIFVEKTLLKHGWQGKKKLPTREQAAALVFESAQDFNFGINRYLYIGKTGVWSENLYRDFSRILTDSKDYAFVSNLENFRILNLFGGDGKSLPTCSMAFYPIFLNKQYSGNFLVSLQAEDHLLKDRVLMSIKQVGDSLGKQIKSNNYNRFKNEVIEQVSRGKLTPEEIAISKLPYIFNTEFAGVLYLNDNLKRVCAGISEPIYAFLKDSNLYERAMETVCELCQHRLHKHSECSESSIKFVESIVATCQKKYGTNLTDKNMRHDLEERNNLFDFIAPEVFRVNIDEVNGFLSQNLKIDLTQFICNSDQCLSSDETSLKEKLFMFWLVRKDRQSQYMVFWCALDIPETKFQEDLDEFSKSCFFVSDVVVQLKRELREKEREQRTISSYFTHTLKTYLSLSREHLREYAKNSDKAELVRANIFTNYATDLVDTVNNINKNHLKLGSFDRIQMSEMLEEIPLICEFPKEHLQVNISDEIEKIRSNKSIAKVVLVELLKNAKAYRKTDNETNAMVKLTIVNIDSIIFYEMTNYTTTQNIETLDAIFEGKVGYHNHIGMKEIVFFIKALDLPDILFMPDWEKGSVTFLVPFGKAVIGG